MREGMGCGFTRICVDFGLRPNTKKIWNDFLKKISDKSGAIASSYQVNFYFGKASVSVV